MATWGTEIQKAGNAISSAFGTLKRGGGDAFSAIKRDISEVGSFFKSGGTSVVGINVTEIPNMKKAIIAYCEEVDKALAKLSSYKPEVAFKGTKVVPQLQLYIEAVIEACHAVVSNLLAFNDQLDAVEKAWAAKDAKNASNIKKSTESAKSEFKAYSSASTATSEK